MKEILREGTGTSTPPNKAKVTVHYTGTLLDGTKFDSSRDRSGYFDFELGVGRVIKAWDLGVATMRVGELAKFTCASDYAYGDAGSPPKIPPKATLVFEVELFGWDSFTEVSAGIKKEVLVQGKGHNKANAGARIKVVVTQISPEGVTGESIRVETVLCGTDEFTAAFEDSVKSMHPGETSVFKLDECAVYSNQPYPTGTLLEFQLEDCEITKALWEMNAEEKLVAAEAAKVLGNEFFKKGSFEHASRRYKASLFFFEYDTAQTGEIRQKVDALKVTCNSNLAAVATKQGMFNKAIEFANRALELEPKNLKILIRRGTAEYSMGRADSASKDVELCLSIDPTFKPALALKKKVAARRKEILMRERAAFGGIFNK